MKSKMRNCYTIRSYSIAIDIRSTKTLLVEGVTDKRVIQRACATDSRVKNSRYVIDTAQIIETSSTGSDTLGNREKALKVYDELQGNEKFGVFVDREWDGLIDINNDEWLSYSPPTQTRNGRIFTSGHSIENYSFNFELYQKAIIENCYENLRFIDTSDLLESFKTALLMAVAFSKVFRTHELLGRSKGVLNPIDFSWSPDGELSIPHTESFTEKLVQRGLNLPTGLINSIMEEFRVYLIVCAASPANFYVHGHLGEEVLRAALAAKLMAESIPEATALAFFNERPENREARMREFYASRDELPDSLDRAVGFLSK